MTPSTVIRCEVYIALYTAMPQYLTNSIRLFELCCDICFQRLNYLNKIRAFIATLQL